MRAIAAALLSVLFTAESASAAEVDAGRVFVEGNCSSCHAVGEDGTSPMAEAPPFRGLFDNYAPSDLEEALAEGIVTGHPAMPEWQLAPDLVADVIAYLETLRRP